MRRTGRGGADAHADARVGAARSPRLAGRLASRAAWGITALAALILTGPALGMGPVPAAAATEPASASDGLWYYTDTGIAEIHDAGVTGEGVTIAIIDSPINLDVPDLAGARIQPRTEEVCPGFTGVEATDRAWHATAMASLMVGNGGGIGDESGVLGVAPDAEILHYAVLGVAVRECAAPLVDLVADAVDQGADILNLSIAYDSPNDAQRAIDLALDAGLVVNVAVQNQSSDHLDLLSGMPGVVSIENVDPEGNPDAFSVTGPGLDLLAPGVGIRMLRTDFSGYELDDGTSPATAWVSGVFALAKSAWPDATGNQLVQAAIRSTTQETGAIPDGESTDGESTDGAPTDDAPTDAPPPGTSGANSSTDPAPRTDATGYGQLAPSILVTTDPAQFPDENPLLDVGPPNTAFETTPVSQPEPRGTIPTLLWLVAGFAAVTGLYAVGLVVRRRRYRRWR